MENRDNNRKGKSVQFKIFNLAIVALIVTGIIWVAIKFIAVTNSKYTDNAQVKRNIVPVNSRVQGYIKEIRFEEYQHVNIGDTLIVIDNSEYLLHLAQAEASYANAIAGKDIMGSTISTTYNNLSVSDAGIDEVKVRLENAETELKRYKNLLAQNAVTQDHYDRVKTDYQATNAKYEMMLRQKRSTALVGEEQVKRLMQNEANIKQAKAALEMAKLNLSYTCIIAPCNGIIGRKDLQTGQLIQPGQNMVSVVDDNDVWVIANYKEKLVKNIQVGDDVIIEIDALSDIEYPGIVSALSNATGSAFSLFPVDNSTGNFIKTEQLIPVRIEFSSNNSASDIAKLKGGMSAEVYIK